MLKFAFGLVLLVICHPLVALVAAVLSAVFWGIVIYKERAGGFMRARFVIFTVCVALTTVALVALSVAIFGIRFGCLRDSMCCGRSFAENPGILACGPEQRPLALPLS